MKETANESYSASGVDIIAGYEAVRRIAGHMGRTATPGVLSGPGGFGGLFQPDFSNMEQPVLVSGTDGVGTKLKLAFLMDRHDTVGIDCVAMCVNDIVCSAAKPLFFLDYIACGKNLPARIEAIVAGVAEGCVQAGCALIGGETAEMPGFYKEDEYDLAGFAVGMADRRDIPKPSGISPGDVLLALPSSGLHSNGFSLVRRVLGLDGENARAVLDAEIPELGGTLGQALLVPTRIYVRPVLALAAALRVGGFAHITGGGFYENIPRMLPPGLSAHIDKAALPRLPVFSYIAKAGRVPERDMFNTFNMGVGICAAVRRHDAENALQVLRGAGEQPFVLGEVVPGEGGVIL